ncbi:MAG: T9SS type A sorting domain-containing protein [Saprospiraceae bacterium]
MPVYETNQHSFSRIFQPVSGLQFFFKKTPADACQVRVYDLIGALIFIKIFGPGRTDSVLSAETRLPAGQYIVVVREGGLQPTALRWAVGKRSKSRAMYLLSGGGWVYGFGQ